MPSWSAFSKMRLQLGAAAEVDSALNGVIGGLLERKEFAGRGNEVAPLLVPVGRAKQVVIVGLGRARSSTPARRFASRRPRPDIWPPSRASAWPSFSTMAGPPSGPKAACAARSSAARGRTCIGPKKIATRSDALPGPAATNGAIASGRILGESVNLTRRLVNEPADEIYPETFAARGRRSRPAKRPGGRNLGRAADSKPSVAARCWPWPRARAARRGW